MQANHSRKCEEIHSVNDRCNEMQLKLYTTNEELETTKSTFTREVSYLKKNIIE